ncbi:Melanoma-associated antigen 8 [Sciurus carolinensis]|uniref:Melanoma-associated antigen 8 n=1 Tax=Sciurus carolinensis TaxID=30640 RepID=A0AA41MFE9_SCICA|nr:Melanoma-associated antigen 8 [Sciurus carolinensis]
MLTSVIKNYQEYFPVIFSKPSESMQLIFDIGIEEVGPSSHPYILVIAMGLTYGGMLSDKYSMPKTDKCPGCDRSEWQLHP